MQRANEVLERERQAGRLGERDIEAVGDEEGGYIEMELGLGVLEDKRLVGERERERESESGDEGGTDGEGDESKSEGGDGEVGKMRPECEESGTRVGGRERRKERSVLGRLMGGERRRARPGIEVL